MLYNLIVLKSNGHETMHMIYSNYYIFSFYCYLVIVEFSLK